MSAALDSRPSWLPAVSPTCAHGQGRDECLACRLSVIESEIADDDAAIRAAWRAALDEIDRVLVGREKHVAERDAVVARMTGAKS